MNTEQLAEKLVLWIKENVIAGGCKGVVLGMSGGIDSSVVAVLCKWVFPQSTLGVIMPCYSIPEDEEHARLVAERFSIPVRKVALEGVFDTLLKVLPDDFDPATRHMAQSNLKPRLRMLTLYYFAARLKYMVAGSGNRSEFYTGYFTKHGDCGVDIIPLGNLVKREVRELAAFLGIPQPVIDKPPSAGLWEGQTDEGEMGITYEELDRYLLSGEATGKTTRRINSLMAASEHKRCMPPIPDF